MLHGNHATSRLNGFLNTHLLHSFRCAGGEQIHEVDACDQQDQYTDSSKQYDVLDPSARLNAIVVSVKQITIGKRSHEKSSDPVKIFLTILGFEFRPHE